MHWALLAAAIVFEVAGTTCMKLSRGFTELWPSVFMFGCYAAAFVCNTLALRKLDMSITYAIWCGVGLALVAIIGMGWFREPVTALKLASLALILLGVVGLGVSTRAQA
jgi:small multidrug resistance pump